MARNFDYNQKESYTQDELDAILGQHKSFLNVDKLTADLETAQGELKPFKTKARESKLQSLIPDTANKELSADIISLTKLEDDMNDEQISEAFNKTVASRDFLKAPVINDKAGKKVETFKKSITPKEQTVEEFKQEQRLRNI